MAGRQPDRPHPGGYDQGPNHGIPQAPGRRPPPPPDPGAYQRPPQAPGGRPRRPPGPGGYDQPPGLAEQPTTPVPQQGPQPTRYYEQPPLPAPAPYEQDPDPHPRERPPAQYQPAAEPYEPPPPPRDYSGPAYREPEESPVDYQRERDRRADRTTLIANTIRVVTALIALVFVLHIVFTLFGANPDSGVVAFVYGTAKIFVFGFGDVFTPGDATIGLIVNYGLAAIVYLVVGRVIHRTLRNR
ncbi:hypothetical protein ACQPZA_02345 [Pseudonocardia xinjiangensis]|uniref:hypothetical protein n=1 Tax=Pseudonocardia xinjiangensis TaxID=75289 RepID=UPI003D93414B